MRLLIIDPNGNGLDLAVRAQREGHEVKLFLRQTPKNEFIGRGYVELVDDYKPWLRWSNLTFNTDNTYYLRDLDSFRRDGGLVVGATQESAEWELDREVGMEVLRKHDIVVPPYEEFNDYDKAIRHVKNSMLRFVSKPSGDADKSLSYCSHGPADMVFMLERWKRLGKLKSPFILQEFVPGIEMAVGGWIGPEGFLEGWCENFEHKKLMNNDLGVATGEQGTVLRYVKTSRLAEKVLKPLEDAIVQSGHTGYVDVNCIIDENGVPWPLEFTMRPGWPTFNIQEPLLEGDICEWLMDLANGEADHPISMGSISVGVVLSVPDYPYSHMTKKEVAGIPIYGIDYHLIDHIHPCEMMMGKAPVLSGESLSEELIPMTGGDYVLVMTATGETVQEARQTVYRRLKRLEIPNSPMYRTDIGSRLAKQLPTLQKLGYAKGMVYST